MALTALVQAGSHWRGLAQGLLSLRRGATLSAIVTIIMSSVAVQQNAFADPAPAIGTEGNERVIQPHEIQPGTWWRPAGMFASGTELSEADVLDSVLDADVVVLGESHYVPDLQAAQAGVIAMAVAADPSRPVTVGWEFLNRSDDLLIQGAYGRLLAGTATLPDFFAAVFGTDAGILAYSPVIAAACDAGAALVATNLSRAEKAPVVKSGIAGLDPALLPAGFEMGSDHYRDRFAAAMGGHAMGAAVDNYFAAQCLTDDVMAVSLLESDPSGASRQFHVTGSFHGDYRDGVVRRLERRSPNAEVLYIRFVDATQHTADEIIEGLYDDRYGPLADLVHIVGSPRK